MVMCVFRGCVESLSCIRAEEAIYHGRCFQLFSLQCDRPNSEWESDKVTPTKKKYVINLETYPRNAPFFKIIEFLEKSDEQHLPMKQCQH